MKKVLFAVLMAVAVTASAGEYIDVTGGTVKNAVSEQRSNYGIFTYGQNIGAFDVEGRVGAARTQNTEINNNFGEARVRYNVAGFGPVKPWVRGTLGEQLNTGSHFGYWAVEPGVGFQFNQAIRADLSVIRKQPFNRDWRAADQTAWVVGASYALDKKNAFSVRSLTSHDNVRSQAYEFGYTRSF
jgi:hypothetical protein